MADTITIDAVVIGNAQRLTLEKTGKDTGEIRLQSWKSTAAVGKPSKNDSYKIFEIKAKTDGTRIECKVDGPLFVNPRAVITAHSAGDGGRPKVRIEVGAPVNVAIEQEVAPADFAAVVTFVVNAGFPKLP